ncbi:MAG: hypothetical protein FJY62_00290 [Betaproteobacteria bacterium]|nr:hypothetical protein [Betaproteobacteria bacterium]
MGKRKLVAHGYRSFCVTLNNSMERVRLKRANDRDFEMTSWVKLLLSVLTALSIASCGDDGSSDSSLTAGYSLGGRVSGLATGAKLTLLRTSASQPDWNSVTLSENGEFTFETPLRHNGSYAVIVGTQPVGQTCSVRNGSGAGVVANVKTLVVTCSSNPFQVSGTVKGLFAGRQLTLLNNSGDETTIANNGNFSFAQPVAFDGSYSVTVGKQPRGQTCTVSNGSGEGVVTNVNDVSVVCSDVTLAVTGIVSGLGLGKQVTLLNNSSDALSVVSNGNFTFGTPVVFDSSYAVTIGTQPTGQICSVRNGSGSGVVADVKTISVVCSDITYRVSGIVSGLAKGRQVTLANNAGNSVTVYADGSFEFAPVAYQGNFAVTVATQPLGQVCTVSNGVGAGVVADINTVMVRCSDVTFRVYGTVSGLSEGKQVTLLNNAGDPKTVYANGSFVFGTAIAYNGSYAVTVGTQPTGRHVCSVSSAAGAGVTADVRSVAVVCSDISFRIAGTVSGLGQGKQVTLFNNGNNPTTVAANGSFAFSTAIPYDGRYSVTVGTQPTGQVCTVSNGSGAGVVGDIATVGVVCSNLSFRVSGTVSGLKKGRQVTLLNNAGNSVTVYADGSFEFSTPLAFNGSYQITVGTQPLGQICTVSNGVGAGVVASVNSVAVVCSDVNYRISGTVSGLKAGNQVTLLNNAGDATTIYADGTFAFQTPIAFNANYGVTIGTQPTGQICSVTNAGGTYLTADVANVVVRCSDITFKVSGSITGLEQGKQLTLLNNLGDPAVISANGGFIFAQPVAYGGSYDVSIGTQPTGQQCAVANGRGSGVVANAGGIVVSCSAISGVTGAGGG